MGGGHETLPETPAPRPARAAVGPPLSLGGLAAVLAAASWNLPSA